MKAFNNIVALISIMVLALLWSGHTSAQTSASYSINFERVPLADALLQLSDLTETNIVFSAAQLEPIVLNRSYTGNVESILDQMLAESQVRVRKRDDAFILYKPKRQRKLYQYSGYIADIETGERLAGAHVVDLAAGVGTYSNEYGYFALSSYADEPQLQASYLGFVTDTAAWNAESNGAVFNLFRLATLGEVIITSTRQQEAVSVLSSEHILPDQIDRSTGLGGEFDLNQYATRKNGIVTGTDGIGGLNVRGGSNDQNLVLLDGVPVYNPSHAIGIVSVFNSDIVRDAQLYTGAFPARYSGRLSSVLDVRTKEGNLTKWGFTGSIGPLSAGAVVEGPLVKDKVSILVSGRMFVPGPYLTTLSEREKRDNGLDGSTRYTFGDLNIKLNAQVSRKDRLYLSFYRGRDRYEDITTQVSITEDFRLSEVFDKSLNWGNTIGMLRWNRPLGDRTFSNVTLTASRFELISIDDNSFSQFFPASRIRIDGFVNRQFASTIEDLGFKWDITHSPGAGHTLRFGLAGTRHYFKPKSVVFDDQAQVGNFVVDEGTLADRLFADLFVTAYEVGAYVEDQFSIGRTSIEAGLHLSAYRAGDIWYMQPQPRLSVHHSLSESVGLEANGGRMVQYLHLLTSSGIGLPTDLWVPATDDVKPQDSWWAAAGVNWSPIDKLTLSAQAFYKTMDNLIAYSEGASFILEEGAVEASIVDAANWETKVVQGSGRGYGGEFAASWGTQTLRFDANYTLSWADRQFDELNFGNRFPFRFDRRHSVTTSGQWKLSSVFAVNAVWTYGSGAPITLAESRFDYPGSGAPFRPIQILAFGERNGYRLPAYHRLDVGASATWKRPKAEHSVSLSLYNVYNRENLFYVTTQFNESSQAFENRQFSVLPFIPSLSYKIRL